MVSPVSSNSSSNIPIGDNTDNTDKSSFTEQATQDLIESAITGDDGETEATISLNALWKAAKFIGKGAKWAAKHGKEIVKIWIYSKVIDKIEGKDKEEKADQKKNEETKPSPIDPQNKDKEEPKDGGFI